MAWAILADLLDGSPTGLPGTILPLRKKAGKPTAGNIKDPNTRTRCSREPAEALEPSRTTRHGKKMSTSVTHDRLPGRKSIDQDVRAR